jgi:Zn-dependent protease/CBS domain-containing protein
MKSSWRIFRVAGIDIGVHYTWILIFVLFSWLWEFTFSQQNRGFSVTTYWIMGVSTSLALFVSVLLHELAHSLVAQARGMKVSSITLFIFGGVSNLEEEPEKPATEFSMAIVGPLTSLVLGFILIGIANLNGVPINISDFFNGTKTTSPVIAVINYMGWINLSLAVFNLLPGFPLDGGRVLRSIIWGGTGHLVRATNIAANTGRLFGWAFIGWGIWQILRYGNWFGGIWIAFIGWFLSSAADASRREVTLREHLSGVKVKDVMNAQPGSISPSTSVEQVVSNIFQRLHGRAVPVCSNGLKGIVTIEDVKKVPRDQWAVTPVERIMSREPLYTVSPDDGLQNAFRMIAQHSVNQVLVEQGGQCVGMLSREDIIRHLQLTQELGSQKRQ